MTSVLAETFIFLAFLRYLDNQTKIKGTFRQKISSKKTRKWRIFELCQLP